MFHPGTEGLFFICATFDTLLLFEKNVVYGGTLRWLKRAQGAPRVPNMDLGVGGAMFSPGLEVFRIGITLDASMTLLKSGCLSAHIKVV